MVIYIVLSLRKLTPKGKIYIKEIQQHLENKSNVTRKETFVLRSYNKSKYSSEKVQTLLKTLENEYKYLTFSSRDCYALDDSITSSGGGKNCSNCSDCGNCSCSD